MERLNILIIKTQVYNTIKICFNKNRILISKKYRCGPFPDLSGFTLPRKLFKLHYFVMNADVETDDM